MANLSLDKVLRDLAAARFGDPITGAAVVMAESGGDTRAVNVNGDGSRDRGAWQINDKAHPTVTDAAAFDWRTATEYAKKISDGGTDYRLWSATRSAGFPDHVKRARDAAGKIAAGNSGGSLADMVGDVAGTVAGGALGAPILDKLLPGNPISNITDALGGLAALGIKLLGVLLDRSFWIRLGIGLLGLALAIAGVAVLKPTAIAAAFPAGRAAIAAKTGAGA